MADDQNLGQQQHYSQYNYASIPARIIHDEYDFFAENKYKQTHILPLPQNPEALQDVPDLMPPPTVFRGQKKTAKVSHQEIPHDPMLIDKAATSVRIFGIDINIVDQETSINKGKEKMMYVGESSSNIPDTRLMGNTKGIIINELDNTTTNLGNPNVDHQEIRDIPKLVDGSNLGLHDDQETTRSINKGKEKMHNSSPSSSRSTKGTIIREEKMEKKKQTSKRKSENSGLDDQAPPLFHPSILEEIHQHGPVFLFEKKLTISDTNGGLNRLLISDADKLLEFLREEEKIKVNDNQHTLNLTSWKVNNGTIYLKHEWHKFVNAQGLQCGNLVQGWGYRQGHEFRWALNIIKDN